jgi:hypothetical protein
MERRQFLSKAALGATAVGSGAIWLPGCGGAMRAQPMSARESNELVSRLDRGLRLVGETPFRGDGITPSASRDRLLRVGLESLVIADVARSIAPGTQLTDELAQRLDETLPVLDDCVVGYHALMEGTPPQAKRAIDRRFRSKPETAMDVAERIDARAAWIGISQASRVRLRRIAAHVGTRIRRQSTSALIDDCVSKVESIVTQSGGDVRAARTSAMNGMIQAIWQDLDGVVPPPPGRSLGAPSEQPQPTYYPMAPPLPEPVYGEELDTTPRGDPELTVGGVMLGAGLVVFGIGGIISAAMQSVWPLIAVATPAGVAVIIGIVLLIIGGVQNANTPR